MNKDRWIIIKFTFLFLLPSIFIFRLFIIQIWQKKDLEKKIERQISSKIKLSVTRGDILDRNNKILATSIEFASVYINSKPFLEGINKFSKKINIDHNFYLIENISKLNKERILYLCNKNKRFCIAEKIALNDAVKLENIPGVEIVRYPLRIYPYGKTGSYVIGRLNKENIPYSGIELEFDNILSQIKTKEISIYKSGGIRKKSIRLVNINDVIEFTEKNKNPTVILTLDFPLQVKIENLLKKYYDFLNPSLIICIVQKVDTGEILVMATLPETDTPYKNPAIDNVYEPGSIFKIFPMAVFLEEKIITKEEIIDCENGKFVYYDKVISDVKPHKFLSVEDIIVHSSNIGMTKLFLKYKKEKEFFNYLRLLGFGSATGIEFSNESKGYIPKTSDKIYSLLTPINVTFGQGLTSTPLQIINGYTMIANNGELLQPYIVKEIIDEDKNILYKGEKRIIRKVLSSSTCEVIKNMLYKTVEYGSAQRTKIPGLKICAKTGTAQKFDFELDKYSNTRYLMSCCGFFPLESPEFTIGVFVDEPKKGALASEVAVPIFRDVILEILNHYSVIKYAKAN
ncbi:MAG: penicillin-binding protein 2 [Endomicrobia bacterium]|nr:penicillin-binding protein 2 [Endomicrobiia bacterium]